MSLPELAWFKSSYSGTQGDSCVEIAITERIIHVRDSKSTDGPQLMIARADWTRFVRSALTLQQVDERP